MSLQPPNNPFESFYWLKMLGRTFAKILREEHQGFSCEPRVTAPEGGVPDNYRPRDPEDRIFQRNLYKSCGLYTNGIYWHGFYYRLCNEGHPVGATLELGCDFVEEFSIYILLKPQAVGGDANNANLFNYIYNDGKLRPYFSQHPCANLNDIIKCQFSDYMRIGFEGKTAPNPNFNFSDWVCKSSTSSTQETDLRNFFEVINRYLAPHI